MLNIYHYLRFTHFIAIVVSPGIIFVLQTISISNHKYQFFLTRELILTLHHESSFVEIEWTVQISARNANLNCLGRRDAE